VSICAFAAATAHAHSETTASAVINILSDCIEILRAPMSNGSADVIGCGSLDRGAGRPRHMQTVTTFCRLDSSTRIGYPEFQYTAGRVSNLRVPFALVLGVAVSYSVFAALVSFWFTNVTGLSYWTLRADASTSFTYILLMNLAVWGSWALFAPAAFALGRRFRFARGQWREALVVHVAAALVVTCAHILFVATARFGLQTAWGVDTEWAANVRDAFFRTLDFELPVYWALVGLQHAVDYYREAREKELASAQLETRLVESQLQALQRQLHPHFLFNTLHAISALIHREPDRADAMIERLSDLLRITLNKVGIQEVPLFEELEYLRAYLDIEQVHFGDRLEIVYDVDPHTSDAMVPNLLLQPIAENAIRHGLERRAGRGRLQVVARHDAERLILQVIDNGRGLSPTVRDGGVGLSNTRSRLARLYGEAAHLLLEPNSSGGVVVTIELPFKRRRPHENPSRGRRRSADGTRAAADAAV
jgi:glucose-6-phosphate-specific signal transduction histidine kinase